MAPSLSRAALMRQHGCRWWATLHLEAEGRRAENISVLGSDSAKPVVHVVGKGDVRAVVLRQRTTERMASRPSCRPWGVRGAPRLCTTMPGTHASGGHEWADRLLQPPFCDMVSAAVVVGRRRGTDLSRAGKALDALP
jgi:hypothetical protein